MSQLLKTKMKYRFREKNVHSKNCKKLMAKRLKQEKAGNEEKEGEMTLTMCMKKVKMNLSQNTVRAACSKIVVPNLT